MSRLGHPLRPSPRNLRAAPRTHPGCDPTSRIVQAFCEDEEAATLSDGGCNRRCPGCNRMYPGLRRALLRGRGGDGHGRRGGRVCRRPCVEPHRGAARRESGSTLSRVAAWPRAVAAWTRAVAACMHRIAAWIHGQQPPFRMVAASIAYGCRPGDTRLGVVQRAARRPATRGLLTMAPPRRKACPAPRLKPPAYSLVLTAHH